MIKHKNDFFSKIPNWFYWVFGILVFWYYILPYLRKLSNRATAVLGSSGTLPSSISNNNPNDSVIINGKQYQVNSSLCNNVSDLVYKAIHENMWGLTEDEDSVIANLNRLSNVGEVYLVNGYYMQDHAHSLRSDVFQYLDSSERSRIKSFILSSLT